MAFRRTKQTTIRNGRRYRAYRGRNQAGVMTTVWRRDAKLPKADRWAQGVDKEMKKKGTEGALTRQAQRAGMKPLPFARKVLRENKAAERKGTRKPYIGRTQRRAQFALNVQKRK